MDEKVVVEEVVIPSPPIEEENVTDKNKLDVACYAGLVLRVLQLVFSLISFSVMSSLNSCQTQLSDVQAFTYVLACHEFFFKWIPKDLFWRFPGS